jgi:hypothetical protein
LATPEENGRLGRHAQMGGGGIFKLILTKQFWSVETENVCFGTDKLLNLINQVCHLYNIAQTLSPPTNTAKYFKYTYEMCTYFFQTVKQKPAILELFHYFGFACLYLPKN